MTHSTKAIYLDNTYIDTWETQVVGHGHDEKGSFVLLEETIFYPQGGGQPCDLGTLLCASQGTSHGVEKVLNVEGEIRHYLMPGMLGEALQGQKVMCHIDKPRRMTCARYHTAAHLLGNVVEALYPHTTATKGHSFPGEACVEFMGQTLPELLKVQEALEEALEKNLLTRCFSMDVEAFEAAFYPLSYVTPGHKVFRAMQIGTFPPVPCGGTHVAALGEIGTLRVTKIKEKKGVMRLSYEVHEVL